MCNYNKTTKAHVFDPWPAQEEYEEKLKELEDVANPVISAAYAASGGGAGGESEGGEEDLADHDEL